jgi:hypothetical protein
MVDKVKKTREGEAHRDYQHQEVFPTLSLRNRGVSQEPNKNQDLRKEIKKNCGLRKHNQF